MTAEDDTRRGRIISTGNVELTLADFAALLQTTCWYPASPAQPATDTEELLARCWNDLHAIDPGIAQAVWSVALSNGAHPAHIVSLADLMAAPTNQKADPR